MADRLTPDELAEIYKTHEEDQKGLDADAENGLIVLPPWSAHPHRAALLRHIEALEQEVERLRKIHSGHDLEALLETYILLHKGKVTAHWLWVAIERIGGGETVAECLEDYGYAPLARAEAAERKLAQMQEWRNEAVEGKLSAERKLARLVDRLGNVECYNHGAGDFYMCKDVDAIVAEATGEGK